MNTQYFKSLTQELSSLKNRVRYYIDDRHWLSDGEWKESVLRTILRRHLPSTVGIGRGFVITTEISSRQIDILLYDKTKPILFQDGDFVLVTPDSARGAIEVKTRVRRNHLEDHLNKLADIAELINSGSTNKSRFFGLFSYEDSNFNIEDVLQPLNRCVQQKSERVINCTSFGDHLFIRFWHFSPFEIITQPINQWHAYKLEKKAPAYFIHNVVDHMCPQWADVNNEIWYPTSGKEGYKIAEIGMVDTEQGAQA